MSLNLGKRPPEWWKNEPYRGILKRNKPTKGENGTWFDNGRFTGLGYDNKLQPSNVANINNYAEHEGEFVVNADQVRALGGPQAVDGAVKQMAMNIRGLGMRGYQEGGAPNIHDPNPNLFGSPVAGTGVNYSYPTDIKTGVTDWSSPTKISLEPVKLTNLTGANIVRDTGVSGVGETALTITGAPTGVGTGAGTGTTTGIGGIGTSAYRSGLARLGDTDKLFRTEANIALQNVRGAGAAEQAALRQNLAQAGVGGGAAQAAQATLARDVGAQAAGVAAQTALGAQQRKLEAAGQLASQGMAGMNYEENRRQFDEGTRRFDKGMQQDALDVMIKASDWEGAGKAYNDLYGTTIDFTKVENQETAKKLADANLGLATALDPFSDSTTAMADANVRTYAQNKWDVLPQSTKDSFGNDFGRFLEQEVRTGLYNKSEIGKLISSLDDNTISTLWGVTDPAEISKIRNAIGKLNISGGFKYNPASGAMTFDDDLIADVVELEVQTPAEIAAAAETEKTDLFSAFDLDIDTNPFGQTGKDILTNTSMTDADKQRVYDAQADYLIKNPNEIIIKKIKKGDPIYNSIITKLPILSLKVQPTDGYYSYNGNIIKTSTNSKGAIWFTDPLTGKSTSKIGIGSILPNGYQIENFENAPNGIRVSGEQHPGGIGHTSWNGSLETVVGWVVDTLYK